MDIAIDFDGTCVLHEYPNLGKDIGAAPVLKQLIKKGHRLILFTMRSEKKLEEAITWFNSNEIPLYGIQINPDQMSWTSSSKCYAQLYIDDAALGCPLTQKDLKFEEWKLPYSPFLSPKQSDNYFYYQAIRPYVDWGQVEQELIRRKIL